MEGFLQRAVGFITGNGLWNGIGEILITFRVCLSIQVSFYKYMDSHCKDEMVPWPSYHYSGSYILGKTVYILKQCRGFIGLFIWYLMTKYWGIAFGYTVFSIATFPISQIAKFMAPTWGPSGSCRPQMGPMLAPWTLLSGMFNTLHNSSLPKRILRHVLYNILVLANSGRNVLYRWRCLPFGVCVCPHSPPLNDINADIQFTWFIIVTVIDTIMDKYSIKYQKKYLLNINNLWHLLYFSCQIIF